MCTICGLNKEKLTDIKMPSLKSLPPLGIDKPYFPTAWMDDVVQIEESLENLENLEYLENVEQFLSREKLRLIAEPSKR